MTVSEARELILAMRDEGLDCPCCLRFIKVYPRRFDKFYAQVLVHMCQYFDRNPDKEWVHLPDLLTAKRSKAANGGTGAMLRYWGVIEKRVGKRADGGRNTGL